MIISTRQVIHHQHEYYAHDNHHHHHHDDHLETQCTSASVRPTTKSNAVHRKIFLFCTTDIFLNSIVVDI